MPLVLVAAPPWVERPRDLAGLGTLADLIELRLDLLRGESVAAWIAAAPRPVLATVRSRAEGGAFHGEPLEAAALLLEAVEAGAAWLDVEAPLVGRVAAAARARGVRVLASTHGEGPTWLPRDEVDAWKVARPVHDAASARATLEIARRLARASARGGIPPATVVPYGTLGAGWRVLTAAIAAAEGVEPFVFGGPPTTRVGALGPLAQLPPLDRLLDELRLGELGPAPKVYGLLGRPPARSPSPALHNAAFRALGRDALYVPEVDLSAAEGLALPYEGWSVTTPRKEEAARLCDVLEATAARCGAVNTIRRGAGGGLEGSNTDATAVLEALVERGLSRGRARVLGSGGFARAAVAALLEAGLTVRMAGRDAARVARVAAELGVEAGGEGFDAAADEVVLVQATPVGSDGALPSAWKDALGRWPARLLVLDAPYAAGARPGAVAVAARARGLHVEDGPSLLRRQAMGQALRFSGHAPDPRVFACAFHPATNVALFGPRAAGKTTVGRLVARALGRPFVDTDLELARREGRSVGELLVRAGEAAFRRLEEEVVQRALGRRGIVLAVGGGAPMRPANARALRARAFPVRLTVTPEEAARRRAGDPTPRPLLLGASDPLEEGRRVAEEREPVYAALARATVPTDGRDAAEVAEEVTRLAFEAFLGREGVR